MIFFPAIFTIKYSTQSIQYAYFVHIMHPFTLQSYPVLVQAKNTYRGIGYGIIYYQSYRIEIITRLVHCIYIPARNQNLACKQDFLHTPVGFIRIRR